MFFIIEEGKETVIDFLQEAVKLFYLNFEIRIK